MTATLMTDLSRTGQWSVQFVSSEGGILARGEGYPTKEDMPRGIEEARAALRLTKTADGPVVAPSVTDTARGTINPLVDMAQFVTDPGVRSYGGA